QRVHFQEFALDDWTFQDRFAEILRRYQSLWHDGKTVFHGADAEWALAEEPPSTASLVASIRSVNL
ncbi:unnamed protein product, partial [Amoebophrya sp. A25]